MTSRTTPAFRRDIRRLTNDERFSARRAYKLFRADSQHNSLHFKKLSGFDDLSSVRVTLDFRAVARRTGNALDRIWIGHHGDFDNLFG